MPYIAFAPCIVCGTGFSFNPELVPSHPMRGGKPSGDYDDPKGPICETCIDALNTERKRRGEPTWHVPAGAYETAEGLPE